MTRRRFEELTPKTRRRLVTLSLLRSAASVAVLVAVYYLAPLDQPLDTGTWIRFGIGLLILGVVAAWQIRAILASSTPRLRAINAVGVGLPLLLLIFASTYLVIARNVPDGFTEPLDHTDALYFTITVFTTVGFGDIAPRAEVARIFAMVQMIVGLVAVGVVAKIVFGAVQLAVQQREPDAQTHDGDRTEARLPDGGRPGSR
jgi:hypothetical protein